MTRRERENEEMLNLIGAGFLVGFLVFLAVVIRFIK